MVCFCKNMLLLSNIAHKNQMSYDQIYNMCNMNVKLNINTSCRTLHCGFTQPCYTVKDSNGYFYTINDTTQKNSIIYYTLQNVVI